MKNTKIRESVLEFIKQNPGSSVEAITVAVKSSNILTRGAINILMTEGLIVADPDTGAYIFNSNPKAASEAAAAEPKPNGKKVEAKIANKKDELLGPKSFTGRDNSKYRFGELRNLPKGRLVLALVRAYVEKNPKVSLTKLQEVFQSKEIQIRFGVLDDVKVAKSFTKNSVDRFFLKNDDLIKLANGTKIAVCNQWMPESIAKILKLAGPLGFKIKVEEAAE
ncbi:MAG TPA: hypothetical protein VK783_05125 [Bacteroidia bacterium]|nr:hypothetical protein [Bacteroidia bacterium]